MSIGSKVKIIGKHMTGQQGRIVSTYRSPFGASWLVALECGNTVAVRKIDLVSC